LNQKEAEDIAAAAEGLLYGAGIEEIEGSIFFISN